MFPVNELSMRTEHLTQYDAIRIVAALGVVATHEAGAFPQLASGVYAKDIGLLVFSATRWCVPLFILLSGALLLKNDRIDNLQVFYIRRFAKILPPVLFWTFAYGIRVIFSGNPHALRDIAMRVALGMTANHLWYLHMLAGLYLAAPFLQKLSNCFAPKTVGIAAVYLLTCLGIDTTFSLFFGAPGRHTRTFLLYWMPYVGYFLAGPTFGIRPPHLTKPRTKVICGILLVISITLGVTANFAIPPSLTDRESFLSSYFNPFVILQALILFRLLSYLDFPSPDSPKGRWLVRLGQLTFGTYLVHPMVSQMLKSFRIMEIGQPTLAESLCVLLLRILLVTLMSVALTAIIKRVPILRNVV